MPPKNSVSIFCTICNLNTYHDSRNTIQRLAELLWLLCEIDIVYFVRNRVPCILLCTHPFCA